MVKYISNKKVNPKNANDLKDFDSIGDSIWNFISAVYQASCYKTRVWTDFRVRVRTEIRYSSSYIISL